MTIQSFIEKAIEGGYEPGWRIGEEHVYYSWYVSHFLLQPDVWKAVGKVEGWKLHDSRWEDGLCTDCYKEESHPADYVVNMHRMIDALADGKSVEEYLATL